MRKTIWTTFAGSHQPISETGQPKQSPIVTDSAERMDNHESSPSSSNQAQGGTGGISSQNTTPGSLQRVFPGNNTYLFVELVIETLRHFHSGRK